MGLNNLAAFDFEVQHRPGKSNDNVYGLSRIPIVSQVTASHTKRWQTNENKVPRDKYSTQKKTHLTHLTRITKTFF